jgi:thiol:disulfide interchange protein
VEKKRVKTLVADWSSQDPDGEIGRTLAALGSMQLPVVAVFPADDPFHPVVITGAYTRATLLSAISQGGKSADQPSMNVSKTSLENAPR